MRLDIVRFLERPSSLSLSLSLSFGSLQKIFAKVTCAFIIDENDPEIIVDFLLIFTPFLELLDDCINYAVFCFFKHTMRALLFPTAHKNFLSTRRRVQE